ncbi:alpha-mannosidase [Candidatus Bipolaricaulota sp. J31]
MERDGRTLVIVVPHTHWDREWYLRFEEFRWWLVKTIDKLISLCDHDPAYRFMLDGQVIALQDYLEIRPEREERLRELIREGRIQIGPWYVQPDEALVSGEALIRNLLLGKRLAEAYGGSMCEGYVPDIFGHIAQLPQILRGFGIDTAFLTRGADGVCDRFGSSEFLWEAPGGARVLCHVMEKGYCNGAVIPSSLEDTPPQLRELIQRGVLDPNGSPFRVLLDSLRERASAGVILILNGCDHRAPQEGLGELLTRLGKELPGYEFVLGTLSDFAAAVRERDPQLGVHRGELRVPKRHPILVGVLSTRMYLKQANARLQSLLERYAEPLGALALLLGGENPFPFIWTAWTLLLQNHAHDSICGTSVDPVHREMEVRFDRAGAIARRVITEALRFLGENMAPLDGGGIPLVVFNPCPWERTDEVRAHVPRTARDLEENGWELLDPNGNSVPFTVRGERLVSEEITTGPVHLHEAEIAFPAESLPALGVKLYRLVRRRGGRAPLGSSLVVEGGLENEFYRVTVHEDGRLDLLDKETGHIYHGLNLLEDAGDAGDEYNFSPPEEQEVVRSPGLAGTVRVSEDLPWRATVEVELALPLPVSLRPDRKARAEETVEVPVRFSVSLQRGVKRVDIVAEVDNRAKDHRLRVAFPTGIVADRSIAEDTFWVVERPTRAPAGQGWVEDPPTTHPQKSFVAVEDGKKGVAIFNRGLPEYEVAPDGTIYLTLLRCVGWLSRGDLLTRRGHAGPPYPTPEAQCPGTHRFEYAIHTYSGTWEEARVWEAAHAYVLPPLAAVPRTSPRGALPHEASFLLVDAPGVVMSAFKWAEDGEGVIVRLYNPTRHPRGGELRTFWPLLRAIECRLDETPLGEAELSGPRALRLHLAPGEIKTYRLIFRR